MKHAFLSAALVVAVVLALAAIDPAFFVKDDFQLEFLPASHEIAKAWMSGEVPLLTRASWMCAALAAEYQFGVFSLFRMLLEGLAWLLPLTITARGLLLFVVHAAIAGAGAFLLARSYGVRVSHAYMVAVIAALNGWMLWWGTTWYAITASWAWLPWYWLGLRGIAEGRRWSWVGTAVAFYLLVTGGAPYVVAMAAFVAALHLFAKHRLRMIGASALGLALSAPAVLMLLEYFPATARSNAATQFEDLWVVPVRALAGLLVPAFTTEWTTFRGTVARPAVELLGATVPVLAIAWAALRRKRLDVVLVVATLVLLVLMLLPSAGPFRWSFRWLPLFHLALAILGASALERIRPAIPAALTVAILVATFAMFHDREEVSRWNLDRVAATQLDPTRRYLALYDLDSMQHAELLPANLPMLANARFLNGYSPMGLAALRNLFLFDVHGPVPAPRAESLLRFESGPSQLLHHFGVDGVIVPAAIAQRNAQLLARNGWKPAARIADCLVLHREPKLGEPLFEAAFAFKTADEQQAYSAIFGRRTPQLPVILFTPGGKERYGRRSIANIVESRNETTFVVRGKGPKALVVFRRPWMPGWRATIGGRPLPVLRAGMAMPAIEIPPGAEGDVRLVYRPRSLVTGITLAGFALLVMAAVAVRIRGDR